LRENDPALPAMYRRAEGEAAEKDRAQVRRGPGFVITAGEFNTVGDAAARYRAFFATLFRLRAALLCSEDERATILLLCVLIATAVRKMFSAVKDLIDGLL
jgi:hypothetical protein